VIFHDFTQGRNALQSFVLLSGVVEQPADIVVLTETQGILQYVNPAFEATTGYSRDEALGKTPRILELGLHDAEFYRQMWAQFTHGLALKGMVVNRKKTGELFWAQQTITSLRDESGHLTHFVSVSQDITELSAIHTGQHRHGQARVPSGLRGICKEERYGRRGNAHCGVH
jgi:PAS domain S-box-containing protein